MNKVIFFGNGPLADAALAVLNQHFEIIFHARSKEDLETVKEIKAKNPDTKGVLASFGVLIKSDVLEIFEPEGILNIHPSLLPKYRGASPIESAIIAGENEISNNQVTVKVKSDDNDISKDIQETINKDMLVEYIIATFKAKRHKCETCDSNCEGCNK